MRGLGCRLLAIALVSVLAVDLCAAVPRKVFVEWDKDPGKTTKNLQDALAGGYETVVVPNVGELWIIVEPLRLYSNTTFILEPGVVVAAQKDCFQGEYDCMLYAERDGVDDGSDIAILGHGAVIRMRKGDYLKTGDHEREGFRHCIRLRHVTRVMVSGLTLESAPGDGLTIGGGDQEGKNFRESKNVIVRHVTCRDNGRNGISVKSVEGLTITGCTLEYTFDTPNEHGMNLEPNRWDDVMKGITISDCVSRSNGGCGYVVWLVNLTEESADVDITFTNCDAENNTRGFQVQPAVCVSTEHKPRDKERAEEQRIPQGHVTFKNCEFSDPEHYAGVITLGRSDWPLLFKFEDCVWHGVAKATKPHALRLYMRTAPVPHPFDGGTVFHNCLVDDSNYPNERPRYRIFDLDDLPDQNKCEYNLREGLFYRGPEVERKSPAPRGRGRGR